MNRLVLSLVGILACIAACQGNPNNDFPFGRIVNGEATTIEAHPYQVSIQSIKGSHFCGGSIIRPDIIVTAAHCMQSYAANEMQVRLGATDRNSGGEVVSVKSFKFHEGYNSKTMVNDVAIIKLSSPVRQTEKIRFIQLADKTPETGTPAVVTGWGTTCFLWCGSTTNLMEVSVDILQADDCASAKYNYGTQILHTMLCGAGEKKDACQGDSGGPLVAFGQLVGVVSWGTSCAKDGYPGVYADVAALRSWIESTADAL